MASDYFSRHRRSIMNATCFSKCRFRAQLAKKSAAQHLPALKNCFVIYTVKICQSRTRSKWPRGKHLLRYTCAPIISNWKHITRGNNCWHWDILLSIDRTSTALICWHVMCKSRFGDNALYGLTVQLLYTRTHVGKVTMCWNGIVKQLRLSTSLISR